MKKTVLFQTIQFSISHLFAHSLNPLFDPLIGPYQVLPRRVKEDLGAMTMKRYSAFPQAPVLAESGDEVLFLEI